MGEQDTRASAQALTVTDGRGNTERAALPSSFSQERQDHFPVTRVIYNVRKRLAVFANKYSELGAVPHEAPWISTWKVTWRPEESHTNLHYGFRRVFPSRLLPCLLMCSDLPCCLLLTAAFSAELSVLCN